MLFLHGSGDAVDSSRLALRRSFSEAPAMRAAYQEGMRSAGLLHLPVAEEATGGGGGAPDCPAAAALPSDGIALFDIYSCFPIAVEMACKYLGIDPATTDVNRLTATGGLAYHGGPGSNYSCHGLVALAEKLRRDEYRGKKGMVCANGGILTEHSVGIYR